MKKHTFIFNIAGGIGKNIMASAAVEALKKAHPESDIIVTSPWTIAWENNPHIEKAISLDKAPMFYKEYIKDNDCTILRLDPYNSEDYFYKRKRLVEIWCDYAGVPYNGEMPGLYFTENETKTIRKKLFTLPFHSSSDGPESQAALEKKPLFFIQSSGGASNQPYPISWARDLPVVTAEAVVAKMNTAGYRTIHLRREDQLPLRGAEWIPFSLREALGAIQFSDKRLFVDSFGAHAAAAWNLPSVVVWVEEAKPAVFGWKIHKNIVPESKEVFRHRRDSYLEAYDISGKWSEHPYADDRIFSEEKILKYLI